MSNFTPLEPSRSWQLVRAFDSYLQRQGRAPGTRVRYLRAVGDFADWLENRSPATMSSRDLDHYLQGWSEAFSLRHGRPAATASYRGQINALRAFYTYLDRYSELTDEHGRAVPDPMRTILPPAANRPGNDWLRPAEDHALQACDGTLQERFLIALLRWTGLRAAEATALTLTDLDLTPGHESLTVRHSKTPAGRRTIPLLPELQPLLTDWLNHLDTYELNTPAVPLLTSRQGTPMRHSFLWRVVKRVAARAGVRPRPCTCAQLGRLHEPGCPRNLNGHNCSEVSPHTLRRTFGSDLINRGLRLEVVSKLLGHATTTITETAYAELLDDTTRRELLTALQR
jgi:integrase